jgi:hypothetical protein
MSNALPPEIHVEECADGVRYRLPCRPGKVRYFFFLFAIAWGLLFVGIGVYISVDGEYLGLLFSAFGLFFSPLCLFGLAAHSEIELHSGTIRLIESCRLAWFTQRRSTRNIRRLVINGDDKWHFTRKEGARFEQASIVIEFREGEKPMTVGGGYPLAWLRLLAADLARWLSLPAAEVTRRPVEVVEWQTPLDADREDVTEKPNSRVTVDEAHNGLTVTVPPAGFGFGNIATLIFGVVLLGFAISGEVAILLAQWGWGHLLMLPGTLLTLGMGIGAWSTRSTKRDAGPSWT